MKKTLMILTAMLMVVTGAQATLQPILYYSSTTYGSGFGGGAINTTSDGFFAGPTSSGVFTTPNPLMDRVVDLSVTLNVSGGDYNGNLYVYLVAPNGTIMLLMDGLSTGGNGTGMNGITLVNPTSRTDQGVALSFYGRDPLNYVNQGNVDNNLADGNNISGTYNGVFSMLTGGTMLGTQFNPNGTLASGTWDLYVWDQNSVASPQLDGWTLNLAVVPEPVSLSLGLFAVMLVALAGVKRFWVPKEAETKPEA